MLFIISLKSFKHHHLENILVVYEEQVTTYLYSKTIMMPTKQWLFSCCIGQTNEIDVGTYIVGRYSEGMYVHSIIFFPIMV